MVEIQYKLFKVILGYIEWLDDSVSGGRGGGGGQPALEMNG